MEMTEGPSLLMMLMPGGIGTGMLLGGMSSIPALVVAFGLSLMPPALPPAQPFAILTRMVGE